MKESSRTIFWISILSLIHHFCKWSAIAFVNLNLLPVVVLKKNGIHNIKSTYLWSLINENGNDDDNGEDTIAIANTPEVSPKANHTKFEHEQGVVVSRREFATWSAAAVTLSALYDPTTADAAAGRRRTRIIDPTKSLDATSTGTSTSTYDPNIPFSSNRQSKSITLSNGMQVLLVSDKLALGSSAAMTIQGAGQFSDPPELGGLAHLMEHMTLSVNSKRRGRLGISSSSSKAQDLEEWLSDHDGASNGFTAYEKVCFHFNAPPEVFAEALERFAGLFLPQVVERVCKNEATLRREIRRINGELDFSNGFTRELYLVKSLMNQEHPYSRFTAGNLKTLEIVPDQAGIDVSQALIDFFRKRYQPANAILVVVSPTDLPSLEYWVAPFASTLSKEKVDDGDELHQRVFPAEPFPKQLRITPIAIFRPKTGNAVNDKFEKLSFQWPLKLDYRDLKNGDVKNAVTATQIGFVLSQILGRRGPGSLYTLLKRRGWIPDSSQGLPRVTFPVDVSGFQLLKLEFTLTLEGFVSRSAVIAAVYDGINALQTKSPSFLSRELIAQYMIVAQLYGSVLAPRPSDAVELAFDGQFWGVNGPKGIANPAWTHFPLAQDTDAVKGLQKAVSETLYLMSDPTNAIIIVTASKKAIIQAQNNLFDDSLPRLSPASWGIEPVTGARFYFDKFLPLPGRVNAWLVARLVEDELSLPVLNPLIPPAIRPARILDATIKPETFRLPLLLEDRAQTESRKDFLGQLLGRKQDGDEQFDEESFADPIRSSIVRDYWAVLQVTSDYQSGLCLPLPRVPPEPSCRCVFVLQLLSSRPARAGVKMAAHAELWKVSLEYAVSDLVSFWRSKVWTQRLLLISKSLLLFIPIGGTWSTSRTGI
jgi:insulysin